MGRELLDGPVHAAAERVDELVDRRDAALAERAHLRLERQVLAVQRQRLSAWVSGTHRRSR